MYKNIIRYLGWNPIIQKKTQLSTNWVGCLSHTAGNHEFFLWLLYMNSEKRFDKTCLLMADNPKFNKFPYKNILDSANVIRLSGKRWKKSQGYVQKIVDIIKTKGYNSCILAPSGKDKEPLPWKTGYYYIAKSLGWNLRTVGFDFEKKRLKIGSCFPSTLPIHTVQSFLQTEMADIVPLRPKNSYTPIRKHNKNNISFININYHIILLLVTSILFIILLMKNKVGCFHIIVSLFGIYLLFNSNIILKIVGVCIIYQHLFVLYLKFPRVPEYIIILGALCGLLLGVKKNNAYVYIPLLYSFLSKVPVYVSDIKGQIRVTLMTIIIALIIGNYIPFDNKSNNRKKKSTRNKNNNTPLSIKIK